MYPYLYLLSISGLIALYSAAFDIRIYSKHLITFLFLITAIFIGFRFVEIGPDWYTYRELFNNLSNFSFLHSITIGDPAYFGVLWILRYFDLSIVSANIFFSVLTVGFYSKLCKEQELPYLAFFIGLPFLIIYTMNFPRQAAAMVIGGYSLLHILKDNKIRAFGWIFFAILFHKTAIIYLVFLFDSISKIRPVNILFITFAGAALFYIFISSHYAGYLMNFSVLMKSNAAHLKGIVYLLPVFVYLIFYKTINIRLNENETMLLNRFSIICIISYAALFSSSFLYNAIDRIYVYFLPFEIMFFSTYIAKSIKKEQIILYVSLLIFYKVLLLYIWLEYSYHSSHFVPYSFHNI
tara:strand:+ start:2685 stop:3737 length:1053 start_codon:yes stop_codon:yes gene_type:complete